MITVWRWQVTTTVFRKSVWLHEVEAESSLWGTSTTGWRASWLVTDYYATSLIKQWQQSQSVSTGGYAWPELCNCDQYRKSSPITSRCVKLVILKLMGCMFGWQARSWSRYVGRGLSRCLCWTLAVGKEATSWNGGEEISITSSVLVISDYWSTVYYLLQIYRNNTQ